LKESTCLETNAHVKVDEYGFFLYWLIEARDAVVLDMGQVCDCFSWKWLTLSVNDRRKIPIKLLVKTFASGKPEKMVLKCLSDLGLCGDKYTVPRVMNRSMGKKISSIYKCSSGRKKKVHDVFTLLSGQKEYLTRDRLTNFLNEEQRDPRLNEILFPFFDNTRTQVLISKYEQDNNYIDNGKFVLMAASCCLEPGVPLPSPNRLRRKILIKNKRLKPEIEKHQLDQFLREGKLDEEDEIAETPEVVGEDSVSPREFSFQLFLVKVCFIECGHPLH
ncbi:Phosphoinositide-specific phospholipase C, efhand-like protein, partial [Ancylostoma ceylanicum]